MSGKGGKMETFKQNWLNVLVSFLTTALLSVAVNMYVEYQQTKQEVKELKESQELVLKVSGQVNIIVNELGWIKKDSREQTEDLKDLQATLQQFLLSEKSKTK